MLGVLRRLLPMLLASSISMSAWPSDRPPDPANAVKLNNLGVAYMNQQRMDKAVEEFDLALKADPTLTAAELNKGIALLNLQKLPEAEQALDMAAAKQPNNARVWYNLGLLRRSQGKPGEAIEAFQRVIKIDPSDPDAHYFLGTMYSQQQQYERAIAEFEAALRLQPLHASAEFGLARALQRAGNGDAARQHLQTFEHLTKTNVSAPITLSYGEQGRYSTAQVVMTPEPKVGPMIPVTFVAKPVGGAMAISPGTETGKAGGGICMLDVTGDGHFDLVVMGDGEHAIRVYHHAGEGNWKELSSQQTGLDASGGGISCAVGDFDNDGRNDLAVAMSDRVLLFRNLGGGKFADVTKSTGIQPVNRPADVTFIDFDHDGDLDLFVTGQPGGAQPATSNVLWRNNGNGTFTNWTAETGLAGEGATTSVVLSDVNNDRAVDMVVTGSGATPIVWLNPREGHFRALPLYDAAGLPPSVGIYVLDFNKDGWMDVALTHAGPPGVSLWRNVEGKRFERVPLSD